MRTHNGSDWRKLPLSLSELCIDTTLRCGQSFRWRKINDEWHCVLRGRIISLKQDSSHLHYRVTWPKLATGPLTPPVSVSSTCPSPLRDKESGAEKDDTYSLLHSYFALSHSLSSLYKQWAASDTNFARRAPAFTGIRILNQDAWEALVAFICSSNNNISRISQMVQKLCTHYGPYIGTIEGEPFHDFPGPEALSGRQVEGHLRQLGFGYRAKYIAETACILSRFKPAGWLLQLRNPDCPAFDGPGENRGTQDAKAAAGSATYRAAHDALLQLPGVGPKVADCVCLMGLGWGEAVPIDTHVWRIAQRDYNFGKGNKSKTLTKAMYDAVGDHFRSLWGPQAGWAQSVLFTANLKSFAEQASAVKPETVVKVTRTERAALVYGSASADAEAATVKVEESQETVIAKTNSQTRKRTLITAKESVEGDGKIIETEHVEVYTRRRSKRIKAAVS
ncbi:N-glycosylase/DNA lyase [Achaetomium macrosporum]|uniref:DNA-(apurinic or apyrimidinic site) lyase n=1 Tax=Achaetomium macrosporum TaxID=79813 RepID=A0AAN7CE29_9PEZI|nr:N-glycosylase/DNA lyase [Achaetomium macrosporum]